MYLQEILEVAIGLVFMWLVLSIAAMTLQEWLGNLFRWRANDMRRAIRNMLGSDELTTQLYEHPVIANLYPQPKVGKKPHLPSYMPSNKFALALFDVVSQKGFGISPIRKMIDEIDDQLETVLQGPEQISVARQHLKAILTIANRIVSSPMGMENLRTQVGIFTEKYPEFKEIVNQWMPKAEAFYSKFLAEHGSKSATEPAMHEFHFGLMALEETHANLKESLATFIRSTKWAASQTEQTLAQARLGVETWFNDAMERLSGSYKRRSQWVAFLVGFFLALLMNVDSIYVATSLWREPTLRQAIIAEAQNYTNNNQTVPTPISADGTAPSGQQTIADLKQQLTALQIPFGWNAVAFDTGGKRCALIPVASNQVWGIASQDQTGAPICKKLDNIPVDLWGWLGKLLGFAITGAATAQGAPFWFDILKKLINVRSSGTNPSEKQASG